MSDHFTSRPSYAPTKNDPGTRRARQDMNDTAAVDTKKREHSPFQPGTDLHPSGL